MTKHSKTWNESMLKAIPIIWMGKLGALVLYFEKHPGEGFKGVCPAFNVDIARISVVQSLERFGVPRLGPLKHLVRCGSWKGRLGAGLRRGPLLLIRGFVCVLQDSDRDSGWRVDSRRGENQASVLSLARVRHLADRLETVASKNLGRENAWNRREQL